MFEFFCYDDTAFSQKQHFLVTDFNEGALKLECNAFLLVCVRVCVHVCVI